MSLPKESIELLLATGRAQLAVQKGDDGEAFFIRPDGSPVGLKNFFAPTRVRQNVSLASAESFCAYFNKFASSSSLIFAEVDSDSAKFVAMLVITLHPRSWTATLIPTTASTLRATRRRRLLNGKHGSAQIARR